MWTGSSNQTHREKPGSSYHVYQRYVEGNDTPEEIATSNELSVVEVYVALAYAFSNPGEMREIEARNRALYDEGDDRVVPGESD